MLWIIIASAALLSAFTGYTMSIQGTTLALGRLLIYGPSSGHGTGVQDAITPKSQNVRNIAIPVLFVALFIITTYSYRPSTYSKGDKFHIDLRQILYINHALKL